MAEIKVKKVQIKKNYSKIIKAIKQNTLPSPKFIRDPIHDLIRIENKLILKVLDSAPMQRLRNIRQLGFASKVYPGAEHSRFTHSLGVYHLTIRLLDQLEIEHPYHRLVLQLAALMHDIGHGPFSHLFEAVLKDVGYTKKIKHEKWSVDIITKHSEITEILRPVSPHLQNDVKEVILNNYNPRYLCSIVSSQFDADRLDYMLRDSYMTGVHYGKCDINWILRNLSLKDVNELDEDRRRLPPVKKIVIEGKRGLSSLEDYLLGNLYLYLHVYYHKTIQAAEGMLIKILTNAIKLVRSNRQKAIRMGINHPVLLAIAGQRQISMSDFLSLTDNVVMSWIESWSKNLKMQKDLKRLSLDLLNRNLFKTFEVKQLSKIEYRNLIDDIKEVLKRKKLDSDYYLVEIEPTRVAYENFFFLRKNDKLDQEIYLLDTEGNVNEYSVLMGQQKKHYEISNAILNIKLENNLISVPEEVKEDVMKLLTKYKKGRE